MKVMLPSLDNMAHEVTSLMKSQLVSFFASFKNTEKGRTGPWVRLGKLFDCWPKMNQMNLGPDKL